MCSLKLKSTAWYVLFTLLNFLGLQSTMAVFMSHIEKIPGQCQLLNYTQALFLKVFIILGQICGRAVLKPEV